MICKFFQIVSIILGVVSMLLVVLVYICDITKVQKFFFVSILILNSLIMVVINPVNETIKIAANALFIRNEFLKIPITSRQQFVITCREHNHFFKDWQKISLAERFWNGRLYREDVNEHMEMVLDNFRESVKTLKMAQDGVY